MSSGKALVDKGPSINGEATLASWITDVSSLDDKAIDDAMKLGSQIVQSNIICLSVFASA